MNSTPTTVPRNARKAPWSQANIAAVIAFLFIAPLAYAIDVSFNNIFVHLLMMGLAAAWVGCASFSGRNLRHFKGTEKILIIIVGLIAPIVAFSIQFFGIGQYPEDGQ